MQIPNRCLIFKMKKCVVKWLWEEAHVPKVVGSNPSMANWMDITYFFVKIVMFVWKDEKAGNSHFLRKHAHFTKSNVPSVTRYDEIPPLWQIFKNIWQYIYGLFLFGQSFEFTFSQFKCFWANFHCWKWSNIENTIWSSGHTERT